MARIVEKNALALPVLFVYPAVPQLPELSLNMLASRDSSRTRRKYLHVRDW